MAKSVQFSQADKKYNLTRFGAFDADFDAAFIHEGDLYFKKNATGRDVLKAFGLKSAPEESALFVVTGKLRVDGALDLDTGLHFSMGLAVLGLIEADVIRLDMTMLFGFAGARVKNAIFFETNDGTLSIAKKTECPLVVCHEGDLNLRATGPVFNSIDEGPCDDSEEDDDDDADGGFPSTRVTMTLEEARDKLVPQVFEDDEFASEKAYKRALKGQPLLRPKGAPETKKASEPAASSTLESVKIVDAKNVSSIASDGTNVWMTADGALLMLERGKFTRTWRADPDGACDGPSGRIDRVYFIDGALVACNGGYTMHVSRDLGVTWTTEKVRDAHVTASSNGVAYCRNGHVLARAKTLAGPWKETIFLPPNEAMWGHALAAVGRNIWLSMVDEGRCVLVMVDGEEVRRVDYGSKAVIHRIVETPDGVLLLGAGGLVLRGDREARNFTPGSSPTKDDIEDAVLVDAVLYAVGGAARSLGKKGQRGFFMRSRDFGATFEMIDDALPGRIWSIARAGARLLLGGEPKSAFAYAP